MKRLFISQPMRGKTDEEILEERQRAIKEAEKIIGEPVEVLDTFFDDFEEGAKPLQYLARSIEFLAMADVAIDCPFSITRGNPLIFTHTITSF